MVTSEIEDLTFPGNVYFLSEMLPMCACSLAALADACATALGNLVRKNARGARSSARLAAFPLSKGLSAFSVKISGPEVSGLN